MQDDVVTRWTTREDIAGMTVSYAQNAEDILLARVFGEAYAGLYVDVGANDPVFHSVTKLLYERGWRGINIEPTPALHRRLAADRPQDINLNLGISDSEGTLTFHEVPPPLHGWSTFMPEMAEIYREQGVESIERPIPVTTLDKIFEGYIGDLTVDVLKVDAEGWEEQVVMSIDLARWRPRVILIEATTGHLWEHKILGTGYVKAAFDGLNAYYVRAEDPGLLPAFATPVNVLDNYIPHHIARLFDQWPIHPSADRAMARRRAELATLGPITFELALRLRDAARRVPRVAGVVKRLIRLVG